MKYQKSFLATLFVATALGACGDNSSLDNNGGSIQPEQPIISSQQVETYSPSGRYPFTDAHGECYAILQMRKSEYDETSKPENFDNARNYYENRIIEEFNLQGSDMLPGLWRKFSDYNKVLWDKYGPLQLSQTMESRELACILIAVTEFTPQ